MIDATYFVHAKITYRVNTARDGGIGAFSKSHNQDDIIILTR